MAASCKCCGVPRLLSLSNTWRDGCIVDTTSGAANLFIYEASYPGALMNKVEDALGIPLQHIVYLAGTNALVKVLGSLYDSHPRLSGLLFSGPMHRLTERILVAVGRAIGMCKVDITERKRGKRTRVRIHDPFDLTNCLAVISGILQLADGVPFSYEILAENGSFLVEFTPAPEQTKKEAFRRLIADELTPEETEKHKDFNCCGKCGVPQEIGKQYSFDMGKGLIMDRDGGERVVFMGTHGLNTIIRELERELGPSVNQLFVEFERENFTRKLEGPLKDKNLMGDLELREYLGLRGLGLLSEMSLEGTKIHFVVENAFIAPLVAGRLLALCEMDFGRQCYYDYSVEDHTLSLVLQPGT